MITITPTGVWDAGTKSYRAGWYYYNMDGEKRVCAYSEAHHADLRAAVAFARLRLADFHKQGVEVAD